MNESSGTVADVTPTATRAGTSRRAAAIAAILVTAVVVVATVASAPSDLPRLAVLLLLIPVAVAAAWFALRRVPVGGGISPS